jgi:PAS domain S-box-containing protein
MSRNNARSAARPASVRGAPPRGGLRFPSLPCGREPLGPTPSLSCALGLPRRCGSPLIPMCRRSIHSDLLISRDLRRSDITFFPAVIIMTLISGFRAGVFCIVLSAAAVSFFLIAPRFSFYIEHPGEVAAILLFVLVSLMMVIFVTGMRVAIERYRELNRKLDEHGITLHERPDDAARLQKIVREANVDALFERMWLASIVEFSDDAIISKNLDSIMTSWNKGAEQLFGYLAEEAIGKPVTILIPPDRQDEEGMIIERIRHGARIEHYETVRQRKDGSLIDVSLTISPFRGAEGKVVGASKIARDITDRKRSDAQISVLAREAEHRAKKCISKRKGYGAALALRHAQRSQRGDRGTHRGACKCPLAVRPVRWTGAELGSLVQQELSPYSRDEEMRTGIDGPSVMLNSDVAQSMAVALHELATNAAKYGALSVEKGKVRVEWSRAADGRVVLRWIEAGGPAVSPPTRKGFGTHVMEKMIRGHVGGDVRLDWRAEGLRCEIAIPT